MLAFSYRSALTAILLIFAFGLCGATLENTAAINDLRRGQAVHVYASVKIPGVTKQEVLDYTMEKIRNAGFRPTTNVRGTKFQVAVFGQGETDKGSGELILFGNVEFNRATNINNKNKSDVHAVVWGQRPQLVRMPADDGLNLMQAEIDIALDKFMREIPRGR